MSLYLLAVRISTELAQVRKGEVYYGHELPREESITTVCDVDYELLAVMLRM